eukprot:TRINITY_DN4457_c4_g1_i1.p1 TRINITY_DN4457_c4_g1~~TRINITY_DN4457_c4_g1_i1.p1  ORF type:complete len:546 (+),score=156.23 TRINITY_DN4457_c4_g1_i1:125-1639(+)
MAGGVAAPPTGGLVPEAEEHCNKMNHHLQAIQGLLQAAAAQGGSSHTEGGALPTPAPGAAAAAAAPRAAAAADGKRSPPAAEMVMLTIGQKGKDDTRTIRVRKSDLIIPPAQLRALGKGQGLGWCLEDRAGRCQKGDRCSRCHVIPDARGRVALAEQWARDPDRAKDALRQQQEAVINVMKGFEKIVQQSADVKREWTLEDHNGVYSSSTLLLVCATVWVLHISANNMQPNQGQCRADLGAPSLPKEDYPQGPGQLARDSFPVLSPAPMLNPASPSWGAWGAQRVPAQLQPPTSSLSGVRPDGSPQLLGDRQRAVPALVPRTPRHAWAAWMKWDREQPRTRSAKAAAAARQQQQAGARAGRDGEADSEDGLDLDLEEGSPGQTAAPTAGGRAPDWSGDGPTQPPGVRTPLQPPVLGRPGQDPAGAASPPAGDSAPPSARAAPPPAEPERDPAEEEPYEEEEYEDDDSGTAPWDTPPPAAGGDPPPADGGGAAPGPEVLEEELDL